MTGKITSDLPGADLYPDNESIDLRSRREEISHFAGTLLFKPKEANKHFAKHKNDNPLKVAQIDTIEKYVHAAQSNIINTIFKRGFVVRTNVTNRVAFFTSEQNEFPDKMTVIGTFDGKGKLVTFYPANGKTPFLTIRNFKGERAYIAYFEQGVSQQGWQMIEFDTYGRLQAKPAQGSGNDLDEEINFLKIYSV